MFTDIVLIVKLQQILLQIVQEQPKLKIIVQYSWTLVLISMLILFVVQIIHSLMQQHIKQLIYIV